MDEVLRHSNGTEAPPESGRILRLEELTFTQLEALDRNNVAVLFCVSPLEEHGPHLPVGTDLMTSAAICAKLAVRIIEAKPGWTVLIGPSIPIGASAFDRAGTLLARASTVRNATLDYGAALARHGFRYILVLNGHGGPRHIVALEEAAAVVSRRHRARMLSVSGPALWKFMRGGYAKRLETFLGRPFTAAERGALDGDTHAGMWETSLVLLDRPELVKSTYHGLPPQKFKLTNAIRRNYPLQLGNRMGYIGTPSAACTELGEAAQRLFLEAVWELVGPVLDGHNRKWRQTSFLYKIPMLHTAFPGLAAAAAVGLAVWAILTWLYQLAR
ncbi:MAG: creatininase family protein [Acidobacteria bacterium]|nr:MAG: creatininase family protein [Acidobacteriota bacterium]